MPSQSSRGVQQHEVNAAADALLAQQTRPTVERVRQRMGHGSPNTVGPMLEHWFAGLAPRLGLAANDSAQPLPAELLQAMQLVWTTAVEHATKQVQAELASERDRLASLAGELEEGNKQLTAREQGAAEREQLQQAAVERAHRLHDEAIALVGQLQNSLGERDRALAQARESIARMVQDKDAAARESAARLDALSGELARLQQRAEGNERRLLEDIDRARQEVKAAQKRASDASQRLNDMRAEANQLQEGLAAQMGQLEVERATLAERLAASERRSRDLQQRLDELVPFGAPRSKLGRARGMTTQKIRPSRRAAGSK